MSEFRNTFGEEVLVSITGGGGGGGGGQEAMPYLLIINAVNSSNALVHAATPLFRPQGSSPIWTSTKPL